MFRPPRCARAASRASSTAGSTAALYACKDEFSPCSRAIPRHGCVFFPRNNRAAPTRQRCSARPVHLRYTSPKAGLERGVRNVFAPESAILTGGGMKVFALPDEFHVYAGLSGLDRIQVGYGFSESSTFHWGCAEGRYHVAPGLFLVLDPDTTSHSPPPGDRTAAQPSLHPAPPPLGAHLRGGRRKSRSTGTLIVRVTGQRRLRSPNRALHEKEVRSKETSRMHLLPQR